MKSDEDVATYAKRLEDLYYKLCRTIDNTMEQSQAIGAKEQLTRQTLATFIKGLIDPIKKHVKARNPETLETAKSISILEELDLQSELDNFKQTNKNDNNFRNYNNGNYNKNTRNYRDFTRPNFNSNFSGYNGNNLNRYNSNNRGNMRTNYNQSNNRNTNTQIKCFNCNGNHLARDCRSNNNQRNANATRGRPPNINNFTRPPTNYNNIQCSNCKRRGHYARDCYRNQTQNNNNNNDNNGLNTGNESTGATRGVATVNQISAVTPDLSLLYQQE